MANQLQKSCGKSQSDTFMMRSWMEMDVDSPPSPYDNLMVNQRFLWQFSIAICNKLAKAMSGFLQVGDPQSSAWLYVETSSSMTTMNTGGIPVNQPYGTTSYLSIPSLVNWKTPFDRVLKHPTIQDYGVYGIIYIYMYIYGIYNMYIQIGLKDVAIREIILMTPLNFCSLQTGSRGPCGSMIYLLELLELGDFPWQTVGIYRYL